MSGVTVVVPSIDAPYTRESIKTMRFVDPAEVPGANPNLGHSEVVTVEGDGVQLVVVWNTPRVNRGVPASWNIGVREMYRAQHEWLVIASAGIRYGPEGGLDFLAALASTPNPRYGIKAVEAGNGLGWHLIAFHRTVFEKVGYFDETFYPAYFEDLDFSYRIQLAYGVDSRAPDFVGPLWPKIEVDATLDMVAHGLKRGNVEVHLDELERYYVAKWGGRSTEERFSSPFDSGNPVSWWQEQAPGV